MQCLIPLAKLVLSTAGREALQYMVQVTDHHWSPIIPCMLASCCNDHCKTVLEQFPRWGPFLPTKGTILTVCVSAAAEGENV